MTTTRDEVLQVLKEMSERYPEWRLGQLVANISLWAQGPTTQAIWNVEDDQLLETIQKHLASSVISDRAFGVNAMNGPYRVTVGSLPDYEQLVAEIYVDGQFVGLLSQEAGPDKTMLELTPSRAQQRIRLDLEMFERAIAEAKQRLWDLRQMPRSKARSRPKPVDD